MRMLLKVLFWKNRFIFFFSHSRDVPFVLDTAVQAVSNISSFLHMEPGCGSPLAQKYLYPSYSDSIETWAIKFAKVFSWLHANIHFTIRHIAPTSHLIVSTSSPLLVSRRFVTSLDQCALFVDRQSRERNSSLFLLLYTNMSNISNSLFFFFFLRSFSLVKKKGKDGGRKTNQINNTMCCWDMGCIVSQIHDKQ